MAIDNPPCLGDFLIKTSLCRRFPLIFHYHIWLKKNTLRSTFKCLRNTAIDTIYPPIQNHDVPVRVFVRFPGRITTDFPGFPMIFPKDQWPWLRTRLIKGLCFRPIGNILTKYGQQKWYESTSISGSWNVHWYLFIVFPKSTVRF